MKEAVGYREQIARLKNFFFSKPEMLYNLREMRQLWEAGPYKGQFYSWLTIYDCHYTKEPEWKDEIIQHVLGCFEGEFEDIRVKDPPPRLTSRGATIYECSVLFTFKKEAP